MPETESSDPSPSPPGPSNRWLEDRGAQCCSLRRVSLPDGHELGRGGREGIAWGNHTPQRPNPDPQPSALTCVLFCTLFKTKSHLSSMELLGRTRRGREPDCGCGSVSQVFLLHLILPPRCQWVWVPEHQLRAGACPTSTPAHLLPEGPWVPSLRA